MIRYHRVLSVLVLASALVPLSADARMYQWVSPASGAVQLSGQPPPWYRGPQDGPRVRVFENGNLVDDTAIALPRSQREELRDDAFRESEQREQAEAVKRLERAARREQLHREESARLEQARLERSTAQADSATQNEQSAAPQVPDGQLDDDTVARLKAIISEYDRRGASAPR